MERWLDGILRFSSDETVRGNRSSPETCSDFPLLVCVKFEDLIPPRKGKRVQVPEYGPR